MVIIVLSLVELRFLQTECITDNLWWCKCSVTFLLLPRSSWSCHFQWKIQPAECEWATLVKTLQPENSKRKHYLIYALSWRWEIPRELWYLNKHSESKLVWRAFCLNWSQRHTWWLEKTNSSNWWTKLASKEPSEISDFVVSVRTS